jgi:hypothetical protein
MMGIALSTLPFASLARADGGDGVGLGPVFAYSDNGGWSLGWEAGATGGATLAKFSIGGTYRLNGDPRDPASLHYVAFEPWLIVGGTFGFALTDWQKAAGMLGAWEGFPLPLEGELYGGDNSDDVHPMAWLFSIVIGWRWFSPHSQLYFSPKIWRWSTLEINS